MVLYGKQTGTSGPRTYGSRRLQSLPQAGQTVLITGGAGFLGSTLCNYYAERKLRVICVDNLSTGRMRNIAHLCDMPGFTFIKHDVAVPLDLHEPIDFIYNMACPASPPKYQIDPIETFHTIVIGSENMLLLAERTGARILEASTSEVYGDPDVSPQSESYRGRVNTMGPRACYDEGKRAAETLFHDYHERRGVDIRVARIFNTYGPGMDPEDGRVVSNFVMQALEGAPLTVYGDGTQTRSFCYRDDLIAGLVALMHTEGDLASPVNLGNPGEFTMLELAQLVLEETGANSELIMLPLPQDDPRIRRPDIGRAKAMLDWEPKIALRDGLRLTIPYFVSERALNSTRLEALGR
ncbi:UDP-glucuronate decarboxylase [Roseivivax lentus]|uniref:UDP-glucuronate decarboxylase n=1 Tax=Roseivivax lentus TaxID=633194 RepID=A0A1N7N9J8_9RHOB|nr:UDP-glucuronic acid decarboxylase family protein [Roseivivax lentus]SIS95034.1 UDP-glucuronate decarboxylase [Roseivivax lentus]